MDSEIPQTNARTSDGDGPHPAEFGGAAPTRTVGLDAAPLKHRHAEYLRRSGATADVSPGAAHSTRHSWRPWADLYAALGWAVAPMRFGGTPATVRGGWREARPNWLQDGRVCHLWACHYLDRRDVGGQPEWRMACCPAASGLVVLDCDVKSGLNGVAELHHILRRIGRVQTAVSQTRSGAGRHFWFRVPPRWTPKQRRAQRLEGTEGIEIKYTGCLVPLPWCGEDSRKWIVRPDRHLAELPVELARLTAAATAAPRDYRDVVASGETTRLGELLIDKICSPVADATTNRNDALCKAAYTLGGAVAAGQIYDDDALSALEDAADECGLTFDEPDKTARTIEQSLARGQAVPMSLRVIQRIVAGTHR